MEYFSFMHTDTHSHRAWIWSSSKLNIPFGRYQGNNFIFSLFFVNKLIPSNENFFGFSSILIVSVIWPSLLFVSNKRKPNNSIVIRNSGIIIIISIVDFIVVSIYSMKSTSLIHCDIQKIWFPFLILHIFKNIYIICQWRTHRTVPRAIQRVDAHYIFCVKLSNRMAFQRLWNMLKCDDDLFLVNNSFWMWQTSIWEFWKVST